MACGLAFVFSLFSDAEEWGRRQRAWTQNVRKLCSDLLTLSYLWEYFKSLTRNVGALFSQWWIQLWHWPVRWPRNRNHHLYAKPLVSRCVKGQLFYKATGSNQRPAPVCSRRGRQHCIPAPQPSLVRTFTGQSTLNSICCCNIFGCRERRNTLGGSKPTQRGCAGRFVSSVNH